MRKPDGISKALGGLATFLLIFAFHPHSFAQG